MNQLYAAQQAAWNVFREAGKIDIEAEQPAPAKPGN